MLSTATPGRSRPGEPFVATSHKCDEASDGPILADFSGAKIVLPVEGGSLRTIITGSKKHPTGVLASRKTGYSQYWEGFPERLMILHSEVDHRVVDYQTQPFRFEFVHQGRRLTYIADHVRQYRDGSVEVVEVKRTSRDLKDPDYRRKLECVRDLCREMGWNFRVAYLSRDVVTSDLRRNLELIYARRFATVSDRHLERLRDFERSNGPAGELGELSQKLAPDRPLYGEAIAQALMAMGQLVSDLTKPLLAWTTVRIVGPAPTNFTSHFRS